MKAFTVEEQVMTGLRVTLGKSGEPCVVVGHGSSSSELPVSKDIVESFNSRAKAITEMREALAAMNEATGQHPEYEVRKLVLNITGQDGIHWREHAQAWASEDPGVMWITRCDVSTNEPFRIIRERRKSDVALVHVATRSTGQMYLESNAYDEELVEGVRPFVARRFHDFPSVGMGLVAPGTGPNGEPQGLFLMYPRSSFRINRDQRPETLVVTWPGSTLKCFEPANRRHQEKKNVA